MSCHAVRTARSRGWSSGAPDEGTAETAATYMELARQRREDDFRWFARSQGMTPEMVDALWRELCSRMRADA